jgi:hypothetical protein
MRHTAMASFSALGFPTPALEDWHYTSLASIAEVPYTVGGATSSTTVADLTPFMINAEWPTVVLLNGSWSAALSSLDALPAGLRVLALADALRDHPDLLQKHLGNRGERRIVPVLERRRGKSEGAERRHRRVPHGTQPLRLVVASAGGRDRLPVRDAHAWASCSSQS